MYVSGDNNCNQLYMKKKSEPIDSITLPTKNEIPISKINSFSTYNSHSCFTTLEGCAFGLGDNTKSQFDPLLERRIYTMPKKIKFIDEYFGEYNEKILSAVCGNDYTLYFSHGQNPRSGDKCYICHFLNECSDKSIYALNEYGYIFGSGYYAAMITESRYLFLFSSKSPSGKRIGKLTVDDVGLCDDFAVALTTEKEAISIPVSRNHEFKMTKHKKISNYSIYTMSGTGDKVIALAKETANENNYFIIIFEFSSRNDRHPSANVISLDIFSNKNIYFKFVSGATNNILFLDYDGNVYHSTKIVNSSSIKKVKLPKKMDPVLFIIAGNNDVRVLITQYLPQNMSNFHITDNMENGYDEYNDDNEDGFCERDRILDDERTDIILGEQMQKTEKQIYSLIQNNIEFAPPQKLHEIYEIVSQIGEPNFLTEAIEINSKTKPFVLKTFKNVSIYQYNDYIEQCRQLYTLAHPLIVKPISYNYNLESMENIRNKWVRNAQLQEKLDRLKEEEEDNLEKEGESEDKNEAEDETQKKRKMKRIKVIRKRLNDQGEEEEEEAIEEVEKDEVDKDFIKDDHEADQHNLDIKIQKNIESSQGDRFYYPSVVLPKFPQNLFDAIITNNISDNDRVCWIVEILDTVAYLHSNKIYHERLTPWNILIGYSNDIFISDIFISKNIKNIQNLLLDDSRARWFINPNKILKDAFENEDDEAEGLINDIYSVKKLILFILIGDEAYANDVDAVGSKSKYWSYLIDNQSPENEYDENDLSDLNDFAREIFIDPQMTNAVDILNFIKGNNYQLLPNVNSRLIKGRMEIIRQLYNVKDTSI